MNDEILLTKEGYDADVAELEELVSVKRPEIAERIKEAIAYGDISENSEYDSAKNEQAELEHRIEKLENRIRRAKIIDDEAISKDKVGLGLSVKLKNLDADEIMEFKIVGTAEADPLAGKISNESSVGAALIGRKKKDKVEVQAPDGVVHYEILDIFKKSKGKQ
ncbi:MAG: transcription elongation factor GreA [Clostridiales Family XIII bacterium]|jgi:transcription elongation factor GreA|nr:transcription elongation factor GreA [Clostridiales Family XIII bacterium]